MKLLLDVHIAKATVGALAKAAPAVRVEHVSDWRNGSLRAASDAEILAACHEEQRALVTFDLRTIPDLLRRWAAEARDHSGVFFADQTTLRPDRPGAVATAVVALIAQIGDASTENLVRFLRGRP